MQRGTQRSLSGHQNMWLRLEPAELPGAVEPKALVLSRDPSGLEVCKVP